MSSAGPSVDYCALHHENVRLRVTRTGCRCLFEFCQCSANEPGHVYSPLVFCHPLYRRVLSLTLKHIHELWRTVDMVSCCQRMLRKPWSEYICNTSSRVKPHRDALTTLHLSNKPWAGGRLSSSVSTTRCICLWPVARWENLSRVQRELSSRWRTVFPRDWCLKNPNPLRYLPGGGVSTASWNPPYASARLTWNWGFTEREETRAGIYICRPVQHLWPALFWGLYCHVSFWCTLPVFVPFPTTVIVSSGLISISCTFMSVSEIFLQSCKRS